MPDQTQSGPHSVTDPRVDVLVRGGEERLPGNAHRNRSEPERGVDEDAPAVGAVGDPDRVLVDGFRCEPQQLVNFPGCHELAPVVDQRPPPVTRQTPRLDMRGRRLYSAERLDGVETEASHAHTSDAATRGMRSVALVPLFRQDAGHECRDDHEDDEDSQRDLERRPEHRARRCCSGVGVDH